MKDSIFIYTNQQYAFRRNRSQTISNVYQETNIAIGRSKEIILGINASWKNTNWYQMLRAQITLHVTQENNQPSKQTTCTVSNKNP